MRGPGLTPSLLPRDSPSPASPALHETLGARSTRTRPGSLSKETRLIETVTSVAAVPAARLFGHRRTPTSTGEFIFLALAAIAITIFKIARRSSGPTPPSSFRR